MKQLAVLMWAGCFLFVMLTGLGCRTNDEGVIAGTAEIVAGDLGTAVPANCPVTQPQEPQFVPPEPYAAIAAEGSFWYGTEALWTDVRRDGMWYGLPQSEGGYGNKLAWWHGGYSIEAEPVPEITLSARQLDGEAVVEPYIDGTNAFHPDYGEFMMTGIELPTLGCWEISAAYKGERLSFVVWIAP